MPGGVRKMLKRNNEKKWGAWLEPPLGEKSEGLNTFYGYFAVGYSCPLLF
jgi:hypothetical protein